MKFIWQLTLFMLLANLSSCISSYSPSLLLPQEPLEKGEVEMSAGIEFLPTANSVDLTDQGIGTNAQINYGVSNKMSIHNKLWLDWTAIGFGAFNFGVSTAFDFVKPLKNEKSFLHIIPRVGYLYSNGDQGAGFQYNMAFQHCLSNKSSFYAGAGLGYGLELFGHDRGFALSGNFGYSWGERIRLKFEICPIVQFDLDYHEPVFQLSPQIGLGFDLKCKRDS